MELYTNRERWEKGGGPTLRQRAAREVARLLEKYMPSRLSEDTKAELTARMEGEARRCGMEGLPPREG